MARRYDRVTPEKMDEALDLIIEHGTIHSENRMNVEALKERLDLNEDELSLVFLRLVEYNCMANFSRGPGLSEFRFLITATAEEMARYGGFTTRHKIVEVELKKLQDELDKIKPAIALDSVEKIASIIANITAFFPGV